MTEAPVSSRHRPALRWRLQGWFWDLSPWFLPPLRRLRRAASLLHYRWQRRSRRLAPRIVTQASGRRTPGLKPPLIVVHGRTDSERDTARFVATQTETSIATDLASAEHATFCVTLDGEPESLPPTWLESQLLAIVAEDLEWTVCGWAAPAADARQCPARDVAGPAATPSPGLMRLPAADARETPAILGRAVPHITAQERLADGRLSALETHPDAGRSGPYHLRPGLGSGHILHRRLVSLVDALSSLPVEPGPPTVLFLLPFLAVGGAESLLFELLAGLRDRYRLLVVTVKPHRAEIGQTVDEARRLTPHVYTLGDWLPRPAHDDALRHLMRRWAVKVLVSWNGTELFYQTATALRRDCPELRIINQLFNHRGGWIELYGPRLVTSVDLHIAVNRPIGQALVEDRGVPTDRRMVIHHGVRLPDEVADDLRVERRRRARRDLGLPQDAVIVGSFMRMHPQKRPLDVIRLARRQFSDPLHFLLVGGGPLDAELDRELERRPAPRLTRLPLRRDLERLYDAVDLCLLPSAFEGLPVFLLDGLARRIPCVATAVGDVPDLLRDGGGLLIERVGDLDALATALNELCDPERRAAEGARGRDTVARRFSVERYVQAYEAAFFPRTESPVPHRHVR